MRIRTKALAAVAAAGLAAVGLVGLAQPASAASLVEVTNFGTNPTGLRMHLYVPDNVGTRPAIVVAVHYCTGTGPAFYSGTEFASLADRYKFIVIYPSATRSGQCFDVYTQEALRHNGGSDPVGIVSMVNYVVQQRGGDPSRVYATGASSGAMMTNVLLGAYPDVFKAGAAFAGVPFTCFATTGGSTWNSQCAQGQIVRTPQEWGNAVRNAFPGYTGPWPRMQVWHGTNDDTLRYPNFTETIKQWTNVHGISQTPTSSSTINGNWNFTRYGSGQVEGYSIQGGGHNLPQSGMAQRVIEFFGLHTTSPTTAPTTRATTPPTTRATTPPTTRPTTAPTTPPTTRTPGPGGPCSATYSQVNSWPGGFQGGVTVTAGSSGVNGWTVNLTFPNGQTISQAWNSTVVNPGPNAVLRNANYNGTLGANASTTLGFIGNGSGGAPTVSCTSP